MDKVVLEQEARIFIDSMLENPEDKKAEIQKMTFDIVLTFDPLNGKYSGLEKLRKKSDPMDYFLNKMYEILREKTQEKIEKFEIVTDEEIDMTFTIQDSLMSLRRFVQDTMAMERMKNERPYAQESREDLTQALRKASNDLNNISTGKPGLIQKIKNLASNFTNSDKTNSNKLK